MVANDKNPSEAQQAAIQKEKKIIVHSPRGNGFLPNIFNHLTNIQMLINEKGLMNIKRSLRKYFKGSRYFAIHLVL